MDNNQAREYSLPHMGNMSYDKEFQQNTVEIVEFTPSKTVGGSASLSRAASDGLDLLVDIASSTVTYVGEAAPGADEADAVWRIRKIDSSSGVSVRYADGVKTFNKVWNDRATAYTY